MNKDKVKQIDEENLNLDNWRNRPIYEYAENGMNYLNDKLDGTVDALETAIMNLQDQIDNLKKQIKGKK